MDQLPPAQPSMLDPGTDPGSALEFDAEAFRAAVRVGLDQADRGACVPHAEVREWLLALARGQRQPPPGHPQG